MQSARVCLRGLKACAPLQLNSYKPEGSEITTPEAVLGQMVNNGGHKR